MAGIDGSFAVFSGEDTLFPLQMAAGRERRHRRHRIGCCRARGAGSTTHGSDGPNAEALRLHRDLIPLLDLAFAETNPGPLKSVLDLAGIDAPRVLQPLVAPAPELRAKLRAEMARLLQEEAKL